MKYRSTRGGVTGLTFEDSLFSGFAADGGILMPEQLPNISWDSVCHKWSKLSYKELLKEILPLFIEDEIPLADLHGLVDAGFDKFSNANVVDMVTLAGGLNIAQLFHGPTLAFKDLAMSCVGQFLQYFLKRRQQHITIVVGTSGDTGSSAIHAVQSLPWINIVVLFPKGRCTRIQELQMTTALDDNVHIFSVEGTSDDLDEPIKACFVDKTFAKKHKLISINSINWGRIVVQIVHHFWAYFQVCRQPGQTVEIVLPTGAAGNLTSACIAAKMGLPIKLVAAVNVNDIIHRAFTAADFSIAQCRKTLSSAMDIQAPYNMERIWYLFSDGDSKLVQKLMSDFESTGNVRVPDELFHKIGENIKSWVVTDDDTIASMKRCYKENAGYLACPHTATAISYHYNNSCEIPRVCLATASAIKFPEAALAAGLSPQISIETSELEKKTQRYDSMFANSRSQWEIMLREKIESISKSNKK